MKNKCSAYHEYSKRHYFTDFEKGYRAACGLTGDYVTVTEGRCSATKNDEVCACRGQKSDCTFYEKECINDET